jgi:hypothetical protein
MFARCSFGNLDQSLLMEKKSIIWTWTNFSTTLKVTTVRGNLVASLENNDKTFKANDAFENSTVTSANTEQESEVTAPEALENYEEKDINETDVNEFKKRIQSFHEVNYCFAPILILFLL